jgi:hypothetical protein
VLDLGIASGQYNLPWAIMTNLRHIFLLILEFLNFMKFLGNLHFFFKKAIMDQSIMALKAIIDRQNILEQNNVFAAHV